MNGYAITRLIVRKHCLLDSCRVVDRTSNWRDIFKASPGEEPTCLSTKCEWQTCKVKNMLKSVKNQNLISMSWANMIQYLIANIFWLPKFQVPTFVSTFQRYQGTKPSFFRYGIRYTWISSVIWTMSTWSCNIPSYFLPCSYHIIAPEVHQGDRLTYEFLGYLRKPCKPMTADPPSSWALLFGLRDLLPVAKMLQVKRLWWILSS